MEIKLRTWEDIETFDDIILPEEKEIISDLEVELTNRCPYLEKEGEFFYYCGLNISEIKHKKPAPNSPIYQRHVSLAEIQLHCMSRFETCCLYSGKLKR